MVSNDLQACMPQGVRDPEDTEILPAIIPMLLLMPLLSGLKKKLVVDEATGIPYMVESSKRKSKRRDSEIFIQQSDIDKDPDRYLLITEDASLIPIDVGKRFLEKYKLPVPETDDTLEFLDQAHESVGKAGLEKEWSECIPGGLLRFVYDWAEENGFFFMNECDDGNPAESFFKKLHQQPEFENEEELMRFIEEHNNSLK